MYIYQQRTGELYDIPLSMSVGSFAKVQDILDNGGTLLGTGYSGHSEGKNNPELENEKMVGPIPRGWYKIGEPQYIMPIPPGPHGPYTLSLSPEGHSAFKRSGFLIHGDNVNHTASCGCIVLSHDLRLKIGEGTSRYLMVANLP